MFEIRTRIHLIIYLAALAAAVAWATAARGDTAGWANPQDGLPSSYVMLCTETVNVNTSTPEELQRLYRVGPVLAERIVAGRPYAAPEELERVSGIGPATLAANWLWLAVEGDTTLTVKVPKPEPGVDGSLREWNRLPGCPDQSQDLDGCTPVQDPTVGTVAWECREP